MKYTLFFFAAFFGVISPTLQVLRSLSSVYAQTHLTEPQGIIKK